MSPDEARHTPRRVARSPYVDDRCVLCDEIRGDGGLSTCVKREPASAPHVLLESEHFVLMHDISPIVPGHALLVSRPHLQCFSHLPGALAAECLEMRARSIALIESRYAAPMLFEHGSAGCGLTSGGCVDHAHIHLLPVAAPVQDWIAEYGDVESSTCVMPAIAPVQEPYLWYQDRVGRTFEVTALRRSPPCQLIRRLVSGWLGHALWNWRTALDEDAACAIG